MEFYLIIVIITIGFAFLLQYSKCNTFVPTVNVFEHISVNLRLTSLALGGLFLTFWLTTSCIGGVGGDYWNYRINFWIVAQTNSIHMREPAFDMISKIIQMFSHNPQVVFFVFNFIAYIFFLKCIQDYSLSYPLSIALFFATYIFFVGIPLIRQFVAVMIIFFAYRYIIQGKFIHFLFFIILASMFHITAFIMIPFYIIFRLRLKWSHFTVICVALILLTMFRNNIIYLLAKSLFPQYLNSVNYNTFLNTKMDYFLILNAAFLIMLLIFYYDKVDLTKHENLIFCNSALWFAILNTFCWWIPEMYRLFLYLQISVVIAIPILLASEQNKNWRMLLSCLCFIYYSLFAYYRLIIADTNQLIPYIPFWQVFN